MRAVVPIKDDGEVRGLVSVGITTEKVDDEVLAVLPRIIAAALAIGVLGAVGAALANRRLRRQTHGLGEQEITRMYEYYDAVLRAVREGLLLLDPTGRLTLMNDEASRLLDLDASFVGSTIDRLGLEPALVAELMSGRSLQDAVHVVGDRVLVVNQAPAHWDGRDVGSVVTLRDRTELQSVTAELDTVRGLAEALRAQNHESSNRMHTMVSLIEIGRSQEAIDFATRELDVARRLTDRMVESIDEPVVAALLLGKSAQAAERGVTLTIEPATQVHGSGHDRARGGDDPGQPDRQRDRCGPVLRRPSGLGHDQLDDPPAARTRRGQRAGHRAQGPRDGVRPRLVDQGRRGHRPRDRAGAGRPARTPTRWRGDDRRQRARRRGVRRQDRLMTGSGC